MSEIKKTTEERIEEELQEELLQEEKRMRERTRARNARQRKRERAIRLQRAAFVVLFVILVILIVLLATGALSFEHSGNAGVSLKKTTESEADSIDTENYTEEELLALAEAYAVVYDYDTAIDLLETIPDNTQASEDIEAYEEAQSALTEVDLSEVFHLSFTTLIADTSVTWSLKDDDAYKVGDYNQSCVTTEEFQAILQQLYDSGYVLISVHDLVDEGTDGAGNTSYTTGTVLLPEGKKPLILSQENVSYDLAAQGDGFASRIVLDGDGNLTAEYTESDGTTVTGDYDLIPILENFIEEHPDFSYHGARAVLSFSGYNGVLGYRTDPDLEKSADEGNAYADYGTFDYEEEIAAAQEVIAVLREKGWEFASSGYDRISYAGSLEDVREDAQKWQDNVASVVGETDILMLSYGADIDGWSEYTEDNETYQYLYSMGFRFFLCAGSGSWTQITESYVRQTMQSVNGYEMYQNYYNKSDSLTDLFDVTAVFDTTRPSDGLGSELDADAGTDEETSTTDESI